LGTPGFTSKKIKFMRSPITWVGGKGKMISYLLPMIPRHRTYVEVFGGGASLLFAKQPSKIEVYNDLNSGLFIFFKVLRNNFNEFYQKIKLTPNSREHYYYCLNTWETCGDEVEKAYRWFCVARMSFGGKFGHGWGYQITDASHNRNFIIRILPEINKRLLNVQVENQDFRIILKVYDTPETFFYLDPPYVTNTKKTKFYKHEMSDQDHSDLVKILKNIRGKVLLSGYPNEIYDKLNWDTKEFNVPLSVASDRTGKHRIEKMWYNYSLPQKSLFDL